MSLVSFGFLIFILILLIAYYICPQAYRWWILLAGSLIFYATYGLISLPVLVGAALFTYFGGILIEKHESGKKKLIFFLTIMVEVVLLVVFKLPNVTLSVLGISFFTFMSISYLADVYWGVSCSQKSFPKLLLFLSFFPQIIQGPINSYNDMSGQLFVGHDFNRNRFVKGLYRVILGLFKKLVIASRLCVYVDRVYENVDSYSGLTLMAATFFYAFQMYCDFSGYMDIVLGISEMFGIRMAENFNLPYLSGSISEYWRRWHITLGAWFRSYIYYPVLRSCLMKKTKKRLKAKGHKGAANMIPTIAGLLVTWVLTGIWHGFALHYLAWGVFHGVIIIMSVLLEGFYAFINKSLHVNDESAAVKILRIIRTFILVDISYVFFRAQSISDAFKVFKGILHAKINIDEIKNMLLPFTEDNSAVSYFAVVFLALILLVISEIIQYVKPEKSIAKLYPYISAAVMILYVLLFGVFGQSSFIYAQY